MRFRELYESIEFEPGEKIVQNGETTISWPMKHSRRLEKPCRACEGSGRDIQWEVHPRREHDPDFVCPCEECDGKGTTLQWESDYPTMRVSNISAQEIVCPLMGLDYDYCGFVPHEKLPEIRRYLLRQKNGSLDGMVREPSEEQSTIVDRSGEIPRIGRGARMIDMGISTHQLHQMIDRIIGIIDWAQKNGYGVRWS